MNRESGGTICRYSPDLDLSGYRSLLEDLGFLPEPIACGGPPAPIGAAEVSIITPSWWNSQSVSDRRWLLAQTGRVGGAIVVAGDPRESLPRRLEDPELRTVWLDRPFSKQALKSALRNALQQIEAAVRLNQTRAQLSERSFQMQEVYQVGIALSAEQDLSTLQNLILQKSREMTGADAGTLYLLQENAEKQKVMVFNASQCDSIDAPYTRLVIPLNTRSIAGFVASTGQILRLGDVYNLPPDSDFAHSPAFDQRFGYHSRSMLVVPMRNHTGEVVGVIQLINKKRHFSIVLKDVETVDDEVVPFTLENEQLLLSFASQAAVAIENKMLVENIRNLFDGFVRASITAIELRDPTTYGHSDRVARLTVGLAQTVNRIEAGRWRDVQFSDQQLTELEYASLLHDFGKVGVSELVLVKAKKLYDWQLETIRTRFQAARQKIEARYSQMRLDFAIGRSREEYMLMSARLDAECNAEIDELDRAWQVIVTSNEPSVVAEQGASQLAEIASRHVLLADGEIAPLLNEAELDSLLIPRGTLNEVERAEIESHVTKSFNFLMKIPWTPELQGIPEMAYAHHERLNGKGYPRKLAGDQIPIQARMMTISDIFDALTAQDRPYKAAVPLTRALDILGYEMKDGNIDPDLLDLFIHEKVYELTLPQNK